MGQKKQRNVTRNLMKKALRQQQVTQQVEDHNASVRTAAVMESIIRPDDGLQPIRDAMQGYYRVDPVHFYLDCDEPEYRVLIQVDGEIVEELENARQADIDKIIAIIWDKTGTLPQYEKEIMGYRARIMKGQPDGTYKFVHATAKSYSSIQEARREGGRGCPVLSIKMTDNDGEDMYEWPYMNMSKEKVMREARIHRAKREAKIRANLAVAMMIGDGIL